jgi:AAA domain (dynein-related subfamily)
VTPMAELDAAIADFVFTDEQQQNADDLIASFQAAFSRESLRNLTLDRYAVGTESSQAGFCYWLEFKTASLGRIGNPQGGRQYLVYFNQNSKKWKFDPHFKNEQEAFEAVKTGLVALLDCADLNHFDAIESVQPFEGRRLVRGKVLFLYFPEKFVPIFSLEHLKDFCVQLGVKANYQSQMAMNRALVSFKNAHPTLSTWSNLKFSRLLYDKLSPHQGFWKIAPGESAKYWQDCVAGHFICIGWDDMGDLSKYADEDEFVKAFEETCSSSKRSKWREVWDFCHIKENDIILANRGTTSIVGIGKATGKYWFDGNRDEYQHCIGVEWDKVQEKPFTAEAKPIIKNWQFKTVKRISREEFEVLAAMQTDAKLVWERIEPGFDLKLTNPDALDHQQFRTVFEGFLNTPHSRQSGFNEHIREDFKAWVDDPTAVLTSRGYVTLSNWFLSPDKGYSESERGKAAGKVWDSLFLCRPDSRLSLSPEKSSEVDPAVFERWWAEQLRRQSQPSSGESRTAELVNAGKYEPLCLATFLPPEFFADFEQLLSTKKQVILQGAPGTGKTFVAKEVANFWAGDPDRVETLQFHESYGYEDFVYGIKPFVDRNTGNTGTLLTQDREGCGDTRSVSLVSLMAKVQAERACCCNVHHPCGRRRTYSALHRNFCRREAAGMGRYLPAMNLRSSSSVAPYNQKRRLAPR